tara:strand:- start:3464 stop:3760 length:297 start_codon:yes stop_codon:yes gene_type:complete
VDETIAAKENKKNAGKLYRLEELPAAYQAMACASIKFARRVAECQEAHGLEPSGIICKATLEAMASPSKPVKAKKTKKKAAKKKSPPASDDFKSDKSV